MPTEYSMDNIEVLNKKFKRYISSEKLDDCVAEVAAKLNRDFANEDVLFLGILNGCFIFASDLFRKLNLNCRISFIKLASYAGTESTGKVEQLIGLNDSIKGKTVVIVEDIVDSGLTLETIIEKIRPFEPKEIKIATMFLKPDAFKRDIPVDYVGMEIPNDFIIGYGLDYEGYGRNYKDLYTLDNSQH